MSIKTRLRYLRLVNPLFFLVWQASPRFCLSLLALALLNGLIPVGFIALDATLLETLVQATKSLVPLKSLISVLVLLGALTCLAHLLQQAQVAVRGLYQIHLRNYVQEKIAAKAITLDQSFFEKPAFHDRMRQASNEASFRPLEILQTLILLVSQGITILFLAGILLVWQWWIVPLIIILAFIMFGIKAKFGNAQMRLSVRMTPTYRKAEYIKTLLTADWATKEIRLFNLGSHLLERLRHQYKLLYKEQKNLTRRQFIGVGLFGVMFVFYPYLLIGFTAIQVISGLLTIGQFSLYSQSIQRMHSTVQQFASDLAQVYESYLFVTYLFDFLSIESDVEAPRFNSSLNIRDIAPVPHIEFCNVSFNYPNTPKIVVSDINFKLNPGESVALVGDNGAGKSTLVKLLTGLYRPTTGQIRLDGVDIETLNRKDLRNFFSVIFQDYTIYHLSTHDNIAFGRIEEINNHKRVKAVARLSGLNKIVEHLPDKYNTILGHFFERGHELSGGQRQLVALTRALMRKAPVLILDEPSSALDIHTEKHFFQSLLQKFKTEQQSVIFISHRFSTVRQADQILVLEQGKIIEQGSHNQLMDLGGRYADMFVAQIEMYGINNHKN